MYIIQFVSPFDRENMTHSSAGGATHVGHIKHFYSYSHTQTHTRAYIHYNAHRHGYSTHIVLSDKGSGKEVSSVTNRLSERLLSRRKESLEECEPSKRQMTAHEYAPPPPLLPLSSYLYSCCSKNIT